MKRIVSRRGFLKAAALTSAAGLLAACTPQPTPTPQIVKQVETKVVEKLVTATPPPAATPVPAVKGKAAVMWGLNYDPHVQFYQASAKDFNEMTGAKLEVKPQGWPIFSKLLASLAAGTQPDLVCEHSSNYTGLFMQNVLLPLQDVVFDSMGKKASDLFWADAAQNATWQGKAMAIMLECGGCGNCVNIPKELVEQAGLAASTPSLWANKDDWCWPDFDSLYAAAKACQKVDNGQVVRWGLSSQGWESDCFMGYLITLMDQDKKSFFDSGSQKFLLDGEYAVKCMDWVVGKPVQLGIESQLDQNHVDACISGKVAFGVGNGTPFITPDLAKKLGYSFSISGVPRVAKGVTPKFIGSGGWGFIVPRNVKAKELAVEYCKYMSTLRGQMIWAKTYGGVDLLAFREVVGHEENWDAEHKNGVHAPWTRFVWNQILPNDVGWPEGVGYINKVQAAIANAITAVRTKKLSVADACKQMQTEATAQKTQFDSDLKNYVAA